MSESYEALRQLYIEAYVAADETALAGLFSEDSMLVPPDSPVSTGRAGVREFYQQQFAQFTPSSLTIQPEEETVLEDWGYGAGTWRATATVNPTGTPIEIEGKYLNVIKRQPDGSWKIHRHSWNMPTQMAALAASPR